MLLLNASGLCVFSNNLISLRQNQRSMRCSGTPGTPQHPRRPNTEGPRIIVTHISSPSGANQRWGHAPWAWSCPCGWKRGVA